MRHQFLTLSISETLEPLTTASATVPNGETISVGEFVPIKDAIFRVASCTKNFDGNTQVELEHGSCTLGDSVIPGEGTLTGTAQAVLQKILQNQTVNVDGAPAWTAGTVEYSGEKPYEYKNTNLLVALTEFVQSLGNYKLEFDQTVTPWRVNIWALPAQVESESRITRNIRSAAVSEDISGRVDRIYCDVLPEKYIDGPNAKAGDIRCETLTASDNVELSSLRAYINEYLSAHKEPSVSVEIDADDLSEITGLPWDHFECGQLHRLAIPSRGTVVEARIIAINRGDVLGDPRNARLTLSNRFRDVEKNLVTLENTVTGGTSQNSTGRYYSSGSSGTGLTQENVLTMLKKSDMRITDTEAWAAEAGIQIEANGVDIYAVKQSIVGILGSKEEVNAALKVTTDNGGMIAALVGRKNSVEEIQARLEILGAGGGLATLKASQSEVDTLTGRVSSAESSIKVNADNIELKVSKNGVISSINQTAESVKIQASKIELSGYVTASQLSAELANFHLTMNRNVVTNNLNVNSRAYLPSYVTMSSHVLRLESMDVVTSVGRKKRYALAPSGSTTIEFYECSSVSKESINFVSWS